MAEFSTGNGHIHHNERRGDAANGTRGVPFGVSQVGLHDLVPKLGYRGMALSQANSFLDEAVTPIA